MPPLPAPPPSSFSCLTLPTLALAAFGLAGCAFTADTQAMMPPALELSQRHPGSVVVVATGTPRTLGIGRASISDAALRDAVAGAIRSSGLFAEVLEGERADYRLEVEVRELEKPESGLDMTAALTTHWQLERSATRERVWSEDVSTSFRATPDDGETLEERRRVAIEGAVRRAIEQALGSLSSVELPPGD